MAELAGKVAIITGGSSGIGRGTAERFVAEGAKVVIADVNQELGEAAVEELGRSVAAFHKTDVAEPAQVRDLVAFAVKTFGGLHVMMNNAGIPGIRYAGILENEFADFQRVVNVNLLGVMAGTREAGLHMSKNGGGSIINVSSVGGMTFGEGNIIYNATKAAVIHFSKGSAIGLGKHRIRVNVISPANIETPIMGQLVAPDLSEAERAQMVTKVREFLISRQPLPVQGRPEDIAQAALFFASDRSSYVTGQVMAVDGGMSTGAPATGQGFAAATARQGG